jgi:hypothetical protein
MRADFRALLDNTYTRLDAVCHGELTKTTRRSKAGRARTNDDDIEFRDFSIHALRPMASEGPH